MLCYDCACALPLTRLYIALFFTGHLPQEKEEEKKGEVLLNVYLSSKIIWIIIVT